MMKIKQFLLLFATLITMIGCNKAEDNTPQDKPVPVRFASQAAIETRAAGEVWDDGDQIGISMVSAGGSVVTPYLNYQYTTDVNGVLTASTQMYYDFTPTLVMFSAYHPYNSNFTADRLYRVDVSDQSTPKNIDLLYTKTSATYNKATTTPVSLALTHKLSKVVINTLAGTNITPLSGLTATVKGVNTKCDVNIVSGVIANAATPHDVAMHMVTDGAQYDAIIIPALSTALTVEFNLGGKIYTWKQSKAIEFKSGEVYTWDVTIHDTEIAISAVSITPWTTATTNDKIAEFAIGEYRNGGVIYSIDGTDKNKYKVFTVHESALLKWMDKTTYDFTGLTFSDTDGRANVDLLKKYSADHIKDVNAGSRTTGIFATDFPAAAHCHYYRGYNGTDAIGTWYLPSKQDLIDIGEVAGSTGTHYDVINKTITQRSGNYVYESSWASSMFVDAGSAFNGYIWMVQFHNYTPGATAGVTMVTRNSTTNVRCIKVIK